MKILHADSGREMRGGQWQALRLHQALIESGHESMLLACEDGPLRAMTMQRGLPCEQLHALRLGQRTKGFDLLHAHDARSHTLGALFSRIPLVVSRRVAFPLGTSVASRQKYRRARRYLAVSHFVAGMLRDAGIEDARIDVVYDGVEVPPIAAVGDAIVTPFTLDPAKGMALAQEAAKRAGVPLICSKDLERDLAHSRALLYLTESEGLGSGILLAMAYGVTVIATSTGGIPELITDGVSGILVQNEPNSVANALRRVDPALGLAAREIVRDRFTVRHMVAATLEAYRKALHD